MMRRAMWMWVAAAVAVVAFCGMAAEKAQVKEVSVRVLDQFGTDATDVLSLCHVAVGAEFSQESVSRDVRTLMDSGRFGYAGVEIVPLEGGDMRVVYVVKRRHRFQEPLMVVGAENLNERKIKKVSELKNGDFIDEPVLADKVSKIRDEYVKRYYPNVKISVELLPIEGSAGAANVKFTIDEGKRVKIRKYQFDGNPSVPDNELRASFGQRPWYDPRGWFAESPISEQDLEDARELAEKVYHNHGYLDAKVASPETVPAGDGKVDMLFKVTEGDLYHVAATAINGVKLFPEREVLEAAQLNEGAVAGQARLTAAAKNIRDYYGSRGYVDTSVRLQRHPVPGQPGRMNVTFDVEREGDLAHIRNIIIRGNNKTKDKVIRREIRVRPGELMDEPRIERSENRLRNLGYFANVRHYNEPTDNPGQRDLVYEIEEQRTGNFMVGAGFSSVDNVVGFLELSQSNFDILNWPNFTGGGQKARLGLEIGSRRQTAEVSWTEPWFLDRPLALTVDAYRRMRWFDQYDEIRTGGAVGLSYPIKFGRVGARYTLEFVQMDDVESGEWYLDPDGMNASTPDHWDGETDNYFKYQDDEYGDSLNSIIRLYWAHDTRDRAFVPTRGYQATLFGEVFEGGIGDNELYKMGVNYKQWFKMPWYNHVLSIRGRFETVDAYSGDVPVYEKLFLGGPRTIRGVEYRDIGPKVYRGDGRSKHAPIGGQTMVMGSVEYTIPVFKAVRFATFIDAGSLGEDAFDPELSDVSVTAGIGIRIDIPNFPIRFDFAKPIVEDDDYTDEEVFSFMIGFE